MFPLLLGYFFSNPLKPVFSNLLACILGCQQFVYLLQSIHLFSGNLLVLFTIHEGCLHKLYHATDY
jgi:hypothetical protein